MFAMRMISMVTLSLTFCVAVSLPRAFAEEASCSIDIKSESVKFADAYHIQRARDLYAKLDGAITEQDRAFFYKNDQVRIAQFAIRSKIDSKTRLAPGDDKAYRDAGATLEKLKQEANIRIRSIVEKLQLLKPSLTDSQAYTDPQTGLTIRLYSDELQLQTAKKENKAVGPTSNIPLVQMEVSYPFSGKEGEVDRVFIPALYTADRNSMGLNVEDALDDRGDEIHMIRDLSDALYVRSEANGTGCVAPDRSSVDRTRDSQVVAEAVGDQLVKDVYVTSQRYPITKGVDPSAAAK